jgi:HTH-type transcriptional regulator, competence development regulator
MNRMKSMKHKPLEIPANRNALLRRAFEEPDGCLSVGGLARGVEGPTAANGAQAARISLARLVELYRRKLGVSMEELSRRADVDLSELLGIETAETVNPTPQTLERLAIAFGLKPKTLLALAGRAGRRSRIGDAAIRFAARSEPMATLTAQEESALSEFMQELAKC